MCLETSAFLSQDLFLGLVGAGNMAVKVFIILRGLRERRGHPILMIINQYLLFTKPLTTEKLSTAQCGPG